MSSKRNHRSSSGESTRDYVDYRHYTPGGMRDRDSRDSHHGVGEKQKSVPGLISDPNSNLQDIDRAIQHGQQESILRSQSSRSGVGVRATQDVLKEYRPTIPSVTHSYYRPSLRNSFYKSINPARINPGFLSFLPGLAGLGLLTAAIVLVAWTFETNNLDPTTQVRFYYRDRINNLALYCNAIYWTTFKRSNRESNLCSKSFCIYYCFKFLKFIYSSKANCS